MIVEGMTSMFEGGDELLRVAEENDFTHAIVSYIVSENENGEAIMNIIHVALYPSVPLFYEIVHLFMTYASDMDKYKVTEEILENMFIRVDNIDSLRVMMENAVQRSCSYGTKTHRIDNTPSDDEDKYGWTHGIAGNA